MTEPGGKKGLIIFLGLLVLVAAVSLYAYHLSGNMGIEERFSHAVGLESGGEEDSGGGWFGFAIEGSSLLYAVVLGILAVACYAIYRHSSA